MEVEVEVSIPYMIANVVPDLGRRTAGSEYGQGLKFAVMAVTAGVWMSISVGGVVDVTEGCSRVLRRRDEMAMGMPMGRRQPGFMALYVGIHDSRCAVLFALSSSCCAAGSTCPCCCL